MNSITTKGERLEQSEKAIQIVIVESECPICRRFVSGLGSLGTSAAVSRCVVLSDRWNGAHCVGNGDRIECSW